MAKVDISRDDVIKVQEWLSYCARKASQMRQHEWEEMERWAGVNCGPKDLWLQSAGFEGSTSIFEDVDVHGPSKSSPYLSCATTKEKSEHGRASLFTSLTLLCNR